MSSRASLDLLTPSSSDDASSDSDHDEDGFFDAALPAAAAAAAAGGAAAGNAAPGDDDDGPQQAAAAAVAAAGNPTSTASASSSSSSPSASAASPSVSAAAASEFPRARFYDDSDDEYDSDDLRHPRNRPSSSASSSSSASCCGTYCCLDECLEECACADDCCCCGLYIKTRAFCWYATCACCVVPTVRCLRRSWVFLLLLALALAACVGVEMRDEDVSSLRVTLQNGHRMPVLALGTWQLPAGPKTRRAVQVALEEGYRAIDTSPVYGNEKSIGRALRKELRVGHLQRADLFVTSKLWNADHAPSKVEAAVRRTLRNLQLGYLDMYLIHWPTGFGCADGVAQEVCDATTNSRFPKHAATGRIAHSDVQFTETYEAMERLLRKGLIKSIGLSNFNETQMDDIFAMATYPPQVLQIENHPCVSSVCAPLLLGGGIFV